MLVSCSKCAEEYERKRNRRTNDGLLLCKSCASTERNKRYYKTEHGKQQHAAYLKKVEYHSQKKYEHTEKGKIARAKSQLCSPSRTSEYRREYHYQQYLTNIVYRLKSCLRARLYSAIKNGAKSGSAVEDLGCTVEEFKEHIESMFEDGMTWCNYGRTGWHIDHVVPLCRFDLTDYEQFKKACHYTNLQPLWAADNLRKQR